MASVLWHQCHPNQYTLGSPVEVWTATLYEPYGPAMYIPVTRIKKQCAVCPLVYEQVIAIIPLSHKIDV